MKKMIIFLLVLTMSVILTSCKKPPQESSSATETISSTFTSVYSELESSEETSSSDELSKEPTPPTSQEQPSTSTPYLDTSIVSSAPSNSSKCSHPDYWEGSTGLHWIGALSADVQPGIENSVTLSAPCESPREVVYKCPICLEPVLVETLEPLGHDFSGEEEVIAYPTLDSEGSWGIKCVGYHNMCKEIKLTTTIPKRGGSYETIDSCFTISGNDYTIDNPDMIIMDRRTWGDVPTIVFDTESCVGTISYIQQDGTLYEAAIVVDKALLSEGWRYKGTLLDSGEYSVQYSRWGAWDGESSNNN